MYKQVARYFDASNRLVTVEIKKTGDKKWSVIKHRLGKNGKPYTPSEIMVSRVPLYLESDGFNPPKVHSLPSTERDRMEELLSKILKCAAFEELVFETPITFRHVHHAMLEYEYLAYYEDLYALVRKRSYWNMTFCTLFGTAAECVRILTEAVEYWRSKSKEMCDEDNKNRKVVYGKRVQRNLNAVLEDTRADVDAGKLG